MRFTAELNVAIPLLGMASTTCPVVTFVYEVFTSRVEMNNGLSNDESEY
jgi:hypothetical protein